MTSKDKTPQDPAAAVLRAADQLGRVPWSALTKHEAMTTLIDAVKAWRAAGRPGVGETEMTQAELEVATADLMKQLGNDAPSPPVGARYEVFHRNKENVRTYDRECSYPPTPPVAERGEDDKIYTFCPECGVNVQIDEDGLCVGCGNGAVGSAVDAMNDKPPSPPAAERGKKPLACPYGGDSFCDAAPAVPLESWCREQCDTYTPPTAPDLLAVVRGKVCSMREIAKSECSVDGVSRERVYTWMLDYLDTLTPQRVRVVEGVVAHHVNNGREYIDLGLDSGIKPGTPVKVLIEEGEEP